MNKDLEWLKEKIKLRRAYHVGHDNLMAAGENNAFDYVENLLNQVEQSEITTNQAWGMVYEEYGHGNLLAIVDYVKANGYAVVEKPEIPIYVAEEFATMDTGGNLSEFENIPHILDIAFNRSGFRAHDKSFEWVRENPEKYVMAAKFGYAVEEKKYVVYLGDGQYLVAEDELTVQPVTIRHEEDEGFLNYKRNFTEREVKGYKDGIYWPFAIPVDEVEK